MNTKTQLLENKDLMIQPLRPSELASVAQKRLSWLWHGYLARTKLTILISPPKAGKTTLLSHLLARLALAEGGKLAGLAVAPSRVLVVSEEAESDWDARCQRLAIGQNVQFLCRPFRAARPTAEQWFALIARLEALHRQEPFDLVVIDPLATLLPGYAESLAPQMLDCLLPLQALANQGPAVWLLHHPAKSKRADGQTTRGTNSLAGFADIVMEMSCCSRLRNRDRRRRICAFSRYGETQRHLIIELNADSTDYEVRTDITGNPLVTSWPAVHEVLAEAYHKRSQEDILKWWPEEEKRPDRSTLSRWLKRAAQQGAIVCSGTGVRHDPYVYWLPGREPLLFPGYGAGKEAIEAWKERSSADTCARLRESLK